MSRWTKVAVCLLCLLVFAIPIEYEYNKLFRHFSKTLIPDPIFLPSSFDTKISFFRSDIAALALFLIALLRCRVPLRQFFLEKKAPLLWSLLLFSLLSILLSPLAHYPLLYIQLLQLVTPLLLFSLCANGFSPAIQPHLTRWILFSLVLAGLIQTALALTQYFLQSPLGLKCFGEPQYYGAFILPSGNRWIFDELFHRIPHSTTLMRVHGTLFHPNVLGCFLAASLLASYALILELKNRWVRALLTLSLPIQFFAMSVTYSRAALFGWALGTVVWFSLFLFRHRTLPLRLFTFVLLSPLLSFSLLWEQFFERGGIVNYNALARGSDAARLAFQENAFDLILKKPLFGHGYLEYAFAAHTYGIDPALPHNIYLLLLAETGLFSLLAFLAFFALLFRTALRSSLSPQILSLVAILIAFLFIGGCDAHPLRSQQGKLLFFTLAGLLAAQSFPRRSYAVA